MKTLQKAASIFLAFAMLLCVLPAQNVFAAAFSGFCGGEGDGTNLQWTLSADGALCITGQGRMADYTDAGGPWNNAPVTITAVTSISLPDGLTSIGDYAFSWMEFDSVSLNIPETVTEIGDFAFICSGWFSGDLIIPNSVKRIGAYAFDMGGVRNNDELAQIHLGNGLQSIGEGAFHNFRARGELTLPDSLTELGDCAFWCSSSLEHVTFGKGLTRIGDGAFGGCSRLTGDLVFPEGLKEIGSEAFYECTRLFEPLEIPNQVEYIGDSAFYKCYGFPEIRLGRSVKTIGQNAFYDCYRVCEPIVIPPSVTVIGDGAFASMDHLPAFVCESSEFCQRDGLLYTADGKKLLCWPGGKKDAFSIPAGTTAIGGSVFAGSSVPDGMVVIPEGITEIGDNAFIGCLGITGLQLPSTLRSIGMCAFSDCFNLTGSLVLPDGLETIGESAFYGCDFTGSLWIPDSVRTIGILAFNGNSKLGSFAVIGRNVESIGNLAFEECGKLRDVYFRGDAPEVFDDPVVDSDYLRPFDRDCRIHCLDDAKGWPEAREDSEENLYIWYNLLTRYDGIFAPPFTDVAPDQYYTASIAWAVEQGITTGKAPTRFAPEDSCTRGQTVTFLWRAAGCPEAKTKRCPFTDVNVDEYYAEAVLWASENGIVNGMGNGEFAPEKPVTRGQMATILYRYAGGTASGENPFTDVAASAYYYDPVRWAYAEGVTTGISATRFAPESLCTRGQIVTFLQRAFAG